MKVTTTTVVDDGQDEPAAKAIWDGETIVTLGVLGKAIGSEPHRRYSLHVAYPANKADVAVAMDKHRDFAQPDVVEKAAWDYMRRYRDVGAFHSEEQAAAAGAALKQTGAAELVESYIYRGPDWAIKAADGSEVVVKAGDWMAGFIWSPEDWQLLLDGEIGGVSVEGAAKRRRPSAAALANLRD